MIHIVLASSNYVQTFDAIALNFLFFRIASFQSFLISFISKKTHTLSFALVFLNHMAIAAGVVPAMDDKITKENDEHAKMVLESGCDFMRLNVEKCGVCRGRLRAR